MLMMLRRPSIIGVHFSFFSLLVCCPPLAAAPKQFCGLRSLTQAAPKRKKKVKVRAPGFDVFKNPGAEKRTLSDFAQSRT